jgi:hypothetical protein
MAKKKSLTLREKLKKRKQMKDDSGYPKKRINGKWWTFKSKCYSESSVRFDKKRLKDDGYYVRTINASSDPTFNPRFFIYVRKRIRK